MFCHFLLVSFIVTATANFLQDVGTFFEPAELKQNELATLGMQIFNIQWKQHGKSFTKELKLPASFSTLLAQIETPLQFASIVICPQCEQHVAEIQNAIKTNENVPKWAVELGVPAAVCPLFYAVDPDLVPICMVGGFGLNMFLANSDSASVCALLPFCSSISGRPHNAVSDSDSSFASAFSGKSSETGTGADTTTLVITTSTTEAPESIVNKLQNLI